MSLPAMEKLVAIKVLHDSRSFDDNMFLSGDILLQIDVYGYPFLGGKQALFDYLHSCHESHKSTVSIKVKREEHELTRDAFIVPEKNRAYVLTDYHIISHVFTFEHYTLEECKHLQDKAQKHIHVASADVDYLLEDDLLTSLEGFNMVYSILVVSHSNSTMPGLRSSATVNRAITWFNASKSSGVPLTLCNVQTEPLLLQAFEQGCDIDLSSIGNTGTYGFHQSRGSADHYVVNAVRLWFAFEFAEVEVKLVAMQEEPLLGVGIGRTIEGFCYVTDVGENTAAARAGLKGLLDIAHARRMRLVVTRVGNEKVLPGFLANGTIKCYDVASILSMLKAYRLVHQPACLHILNMKNPISVAFSQLSRHIPASFTTDVGI